ncbi:MAG: hypothetical protein WCL43_07150 [Chlorobium sp.]
MHDAGLQPASQMHAYRALSMAKAAGRNNVVTFASMNVPQHSITG